jgi:hypothetical protein
VSGEPLLVELLMRSTAEFRSRPSPICGLTDVLRAQELAAKAIEKIIDPAAPVPGSRRISANTGSGVLCLNMVTAAGTLGSIAVAAARVPALTALATAATARNRRRVGSHGGNIGWSTADVFVGGVLSTLSAWVIGLASFVVRVRAGAEATTSPRLAFVITLFHGKVNYR